MQCSLGASSSNLLLPGIVWIYVTCTHVSAYCSSCTLHNYSPCTTVMSTLSSEITMQCILSNMFSTSASFECLAKLPWKIFPEKRGLSKKSRCQCSLFTISPFELIDMLILWIHSWFKSCIQNIVASATEKNGKYLTH